MPTKTTTTDRTVAELEAAILDGDQTVTAEMLAAARAREEFAQLQAEAGRRGEQESAEAARQAQIAALRDKVEHLADDRVELHRAATAAVDALAAVWRLAQDRGDQLDALALEARALGVAPMGADNVARDASGLGWHRDPASAHAGPARLRTGDQLLTAASPARLVARVVTDALGKVGRPTTALPVATPGPSLAEQIDAQVREVVAPEKVRVRTTQRWGQHPAGAVVEVDAESAAWACDRGYARPAA